MPRARRFLVCGSPDQPIESDTAAHGPIIDPARYRTWNEAETVAEALVERGYRGVAITEYGALAAGWAMCQTVVKGHRLPDGRITFPAWICGRHDLLDDDRCPEHTQGGHPLPADSEQLGIPLEVS